MNEPNSEEQPEEEKDFDYFDLTDEEIREQPFDLPFPGETFPLEEKERDLS